MAAGLLSRMEPFDCRNGDFVYYMEQFDNFLLLNAVEDENAKVLLFINSIGQDAYSILKEVCQPTDPKGKPFDELKTLLQQYFARRAFYGRFQRPNEPLGGYINELKRLSLQCNFGPFAKEALRDRIACGKTADDKGKKDQAEAKPPVPSVPIVPPQMLKQAPGQKAKQRTPSVGREVAVPDAEKSKKNQTGGSKQQQQQKQYRCKICGHQHREADCAHKDASCFLCRKKGHIASVCREKNKQAQSNAGGQPVQVVVHVQQNAAMKND